MVSAYPTSGGIYWWAAKLGGPAAGFFTGWLNLIGLLAVTASVAYGAATFLDLTISTISTGWAEGYSLTRVFLIFVAIFVLASLANIFSGHLLAVINNISVWWHVAGAAIVIMVLIIVPPTHQSLDIVFVTARAFSANGTQTDQSSSTGVQGTVHTLELSGRRCGSSGSHSTSARTADWGLTGADPGAPAG